MAFQLPDYKYSPLKSTSLCGLVSDDIEPPNQAVHLEAILDRGVWIRLMINVQEDPQGTHFHVDTARESQFERTPEANATLEEVLCTMERYRGRKMGVFLKARFEVLRSNLPKDGVVALLSSVVLDDKIRLTGGTLSVDGDSNFSVSWHLERQGAEERLVCTIKSMEELVVDDGYLVNPIEGLKAAFQQIVLEA